jgi:UDP-N-acetylglucosamine pyrophosphorylase
VASVFTDIRLLCKGLVYLHTYCVDNCLVRVADPTFLGYCITKKSDVGAKVVPKAHAHEPVGVVCKVNSKWGVVEYSEISKEDAEKTRYTSATDHDRQSCIDAALFDVPNLTPAQMVHCNMELAT